MEQDEILVTLYMKRADNTNQTAKYSMIFYDYDLNEKNEVVISQTMSKTLDQEMEFFSKGFI